MHHPTSKFLKLFLCAAVAGAFASTAAAESTVSVEGLVDLYAGSVRMAGDPGAAKVVNSGGLTTSWFGIKGSEDLASGLKAKFALTSFLRPDIGAVGRFPGNETMFSRDANVGLVGSFGTISVGRDLAPNFLPMILFNPFGDSFTFSPLVLHQQVPLFNASGFSSSVAGDTGWSNELLYTTPDLDGLTANLHYQFGEAANNNGKNNVGGNLLYFHGPLSLSAFYQRVRVNNPLDANAATSVVETVGDLKAAEQKTWFVGAGYDFGPAKLFATYDKTSHDVALDDKTASVGASVAAGAGKILAAYAQTRRDAAGVETRRNTVSLGYDVFMSKNTDLYAVLMNDRVTDADSGNSIGFGIRKRF